MNLQVNSNFKVARLANSKILNDTKLLCDGKGRQMVMVMAMVMDVLAALLTAKLES